MEEKFILDLLKEHGMAGCKAIDTPLGSNLNWDILRAVIRLNKGDISN